MLLHDNSLTTLQHVHWYTQLRKLDISYNKLRCLPSHAFWRCLTGLCTLACGSDIDTIDPSSIYCNVIAPQPMCLLCLYFVACHTGLEVLHGNNNEIVALQDIQALVRLLACYMDSIALVYQTT